MTVSSPIAGSGASALTAPAAATISGDGVSPAASAAASGSPPGNAAATASADAGRMAGSRCRQRMMARSIAGSRFVTIDDGGAMPSCSRFAISSATFFPSSARRPVNIS